MLLPYPLLYLSLSTDQQAVLLHCWDLAVIYGIYLFSFLLLTLTSYFYTSSLGSLGSGI